MVEDDKEKTGFHTEEGVYCFTRKDWVPYGRRGILFHSYAKRIKELRCYTSEDEGK
ncbi:hypothetical protein Tco_0634218, partial [Tanacetum coccineum]